MKRKCQDCQQESTKKRLYYERVAEPAYGQIAISPPIAELMSEIPKEIERLAGEAGLMLMKAYMDEEVKRLVGSRYERQSGRKYARWGSQGGAVVFAGRKSQIVRPRVRNIAESKEVALRTYENFKDEKRFGNAILRKLLHGISSRVYSRDKEAAERTFGAQLQGD